MRYGENRLLRPRLFSWSGGKPMDECALKVGRYGMFINLYFNDQVGQ
jgi:hypothetical protein